MARERPVGEDNFEPVGSRFECPPGTATLMRIGRQAAKFYVTDDVICKIADHLLGIDAGQGDPDVVCLLERRRHKRR